MMDEIDDQRQNRAIRAWWMSLPKEERKQKLNEQRESAERIEDILGNAHAARTEQQFRAEIQRAHDMADGLLRQIFLHGDNQ